MQPDKPFAMPLLSQWQTLKSVYRVSEIGQELPFTICSLISISGT